MDQVALLPARRYSAYRLALFCGAFPLVAGVSVFLLWMVTEWDWLPAAGLWVLLAGGVFFITGMATLAWFCWSARHDPRLSKREIWISGLLCGGLLVSNFPVAVGVVGAAIKWEERFHVVVSNDSEQSFDQVRLKGGACDIWIGHLAPHQTVRRSFWIKAKGGLDFQAVSDEDGRKVAQLVEGYVMPGVNEQATVTIHSNGTVGVEIGDD